MKTLVETVGFIVAMIALDLLIPQANVSWIAGYIFCGVLGVSLYKNAKGDIQRVIGGIFIAIQVLGFIGNLI